MKFSESLEGTFVPSLHDVRSLAAEANIGGLLNYVNLAFPHRITAFFELVDGLFFCRSLYDKRSAMTAAEQKPIPSQDNLCGFAMVLDAQRNSTLPHLPMTESPL